MIKYRAGDVLLVDFPFVQGGQGKMRPAVVVADTGDSDVILARVTTQNYHSSFDVQLTEWKSAGLLAPSVLRLHKLATINKSLIQRRLGSLADADRNHAEAALKELVAAW
jgi:mRNA interferase MazF